MKPYYEDSAVTIYHGDCRDILPQLPKVDLVLTDPPYNVAKADWDYIDYDGFFPLIASRMKEGSSIYIFSSIKKFDEVLVSAKKVFEHLNTLIWLYPNGMNRLVDNWQIMYDPIFFGKLSGGHTFNTDDVRYPYTKGTENRIKSPVVKGGKEWKPNPIGRKPENVIVVPCLNHGAGQGERTEHPTQKPLDLFEPLIRASTNAGDLILDPFMGSGTTLRAAKDLGRKAIGIEIEERYCEIAAKRMSQMVLSL